MDTFRRQLPNLLLGSSGKFALIQGQAVDSVWNTQDEALEAGYERFGLGPFLVKQIVEVEEPRYFSRNLKKCPS